MLRLQELREQKKMTQKMLGEIVGASQNTVSNWESGNRKIDIETLKKLAEHFGVSTDYILNRERPNQPPANLRKTERKPVRVLGHIAAGTPIYAEETTDVFVLADGSIPCDFALIVDGDSMEPRIQKNDIVFIREQKDVSDGEIAAVMITDEFDESYATLKHVYHFENELHLTSDNPKYKPMVFTETNCSGIRILGKAIAYQRAL